MCFIFFIRCSNFLRVFGLTDRGTCQGHHHVSYLVCQRNLRSFKTDKRTAKERSWCNKKRGRLEGLGVVNNPLKVTGQYVYIYKKGVSLGQDEEIIYIYVYIIKKNTSIDNEKRDANKYAPGGRGLRMVM